MDAKDTTTGIFGALAIILGVVLMYFLPLWVAKRRKHPAENSIGIVNLFFGWTVIGWIGCLAWAFMPGRIPVTIEAPTPTPAGDMRACPHCAEPSRKSAKICRFCNREVVPVL